MTNQMQRVINFSGGKTSAYMTITEYQEGDIVLFCDTGREHPKTYKFINDFEAHEGIQIIRLQYPGGFEQLLKKERVIPNQWKRQCTKQLKVKTARRYLVSIGIKKYENLIGFRADEPERVSRHVDYWKTVVAKFPLYENGIDKQMVNEFWKGKQYTLEIPSILGNCDLCFMKGQDALMTIMAKYPELADKWIADEERSKERKEGAKKKGHTYFQGVTIKQLRSIARNNLFKDYDLEEINPAFDCACTT
jgi:hypothetical protein